MNYIVFDLEWNQSPGGKKYSNSRLPFEIIEIGAVKMNEQREVVDVFQRLVKPQVYNWIHVQILNMNQICLTSLIKLYVIYKIIQFYVCDHVF